MWQRLWCQIKYWSRSEYKQVVPDIIHCIKFNSIQGAVELSLVYTVTTSNTNGAERKERK